MGGRTKQELFEQHLPIGLCNVDETCFLGGRNLIFKYNLNELSHTMSTMSTFTR
jgi:hypothetical protein